MGAPVALANDVVSKEHQAEKRHPMRAGRLLAASLATLWDAITSISALNEDAATAFVTTKEHTGGKSADNRLQATLQGLLNMKIDYILNFIVFDDRPLEN